MSFGRFITHSAKGEPLRLSQGAIISGVRMPAYGTSRYSAFVFTARCDLANSKAELVHCFHMVPVRDWLRFTALVSMLRAKIDTLEKKFKDAITAKAPELQDSLLRNYNWTDIPEILSKNDKFKDRIQSLQAWSKEREQIISSMERITDAQTAAIELSAQPAVKKVFDDNAVKTMERLLSNDVAEAHYIPNHLDNNTGDVVLFRHIFSFPRPLIPYLEKGLLTTDIQSEEETSVKSLFTLDDNEPPGVTASVIPPYIEHILQRFSHLYSRIGVEDFTEDYRQAVTKSAYESV